MGEIIKRVYENKELIGIIIPFIVTIIYNLILFFKADEYSRYYGIPIDLFDKISIMSIVKIFLLMFSLIVYILLPFITYYLFNGLDEVLTFILIFSIPTFFYVITFLLSYEIFDEKASEKCLICEKFRISLECLISIIAAIVVSIGFGLLLLFKCDIIYCLLLMYVIIMFCLAILTSMKILVKDTALEAKNKKTYEIIDGADLEYDNCEIKNSKFAIIYYNKKNILVCRCEFDNNKELLIYKQYLVLNDYNFMKSIIRFENVKVKEPEIISS